MASMSYCKFENTSRDFLECLNSVGRALEDGKNYREFVDTLSEDEQYWFKRLLDYCSGMQVYVDELHENQKQDEY